MDDTLGIAAASLHVSPKTPCCRGYLQPRVGGQPTDYSWEGNILKKMSKKVVSILTILSFLLTLVPTVAFADVTPAPKADFVADQTVVPGEQSAQVAVNNLKKGDTLEVVQADGTALDPVQVITLDQAYPASDEDTVITINFKVPTGINGEDLVIKLNDAAGACCIWCLLQGQTPVAVLDTAENAKDYNNQGSHAYFKDGDKVDGVEVSANENENFKVEFADKDGKTAYFKGPIWVWAEVDKNQPDSRFRIDKGSAEDFLGAIDANEIAQQNNNIWKINEVNTDKYGEGVNFDVFFTASGKYRVYVSTVDPTDEGNNLKNDGSFESAPAKFYAEGNKNVANVTGKDEKVAAIGIESVNSPKEPEVILECGAALWQKAESDNKNDRCCELNNITEKSFDKWILVDPNDTTKSKVNAYIYTEKDGKEGLDRVGKGKEVKISANRAGITIDPESVETSRTGKVEFDITGKVEGEYIVYVEAGDCRVAIPVKVTPLRANDIEKVDEPDYPLAAGDNSNNDELSFRILDVDGNVVNQPFAAESPILELDGLRAQLKKVAGYNDEYLHGPIYGVEYEGDFFRINKKPAKSKLKVKDCTITQKSDDGVYAINFDKDLVVGEYEIEVRLDNGRKAVFNFEVKDFGTAKELVLSYPQKYVELGALSAKPTIKFIDENGVRKDATNYVTLGANGYAVKNFDKATGVVRVKNDEKYLGDTINVTAIAEKEGLVADAELIVTDGKGGNDTLSFDKKSGPVNVTNRVKVQVVDAKGNPIALGKDKVIQSMTAVVGEKSDKDAKVTASIGSVSKSTLQKDGTAELLLHSDKATSADVKVTIVAQSKLKGAIHTAYYRGTLHYVFTDKAETAGRVVVMTINSNQVIVDNNIVTIDTAAIIKNDRTFVPFRALAEAFGAEVEYKDGVVTANLEGKNVEMTVDKTEYKVNGEEATMDVAPFIQDERTMIPVRFAAEALGFQVTPTYHDDGTTASVAFQK